MKILKKMLLLAVVVFATAISSSCSSNGSSDDQTSGDFIKFKYNGAVYNFDPEFSKSESTLVMGYTGWIII